MRLGGLGLLYAAQGAPEGLLYVAVPAWLAANGASAEAIGGYIAIILLPWSFKLVNGALMDRVAFLPMGRRRPWLIAAQAALVLTLIAFGASTPDDANLRRLMLVGFLVNLAGAFQDVAIDGMAIDIVPEPERARANGVMWGGKILGTSAAAGATGHLIQRHGFAEASMATAAFVAAIMVIPLLVRERPGERLMPWTDGQASADAASRQLADWASIVGTLWRAMRRPASLILAAGIFLAFLGYGLDTAYGPVVAVKAAGFDESGYGGLAAGANLAGGAFGILLAGVIADRLSPRRALILSLVGMAAAQVFLAAWPSAMTNTGGFSIYTYAYILCFVMMSVSLYAEAMRLSTPAVAATQFALFMAILNFGTYAGAGRFALIESLTGYAGAAIAGAIVTLAAAAVFAQGRGSTKSDARLHPLAS